MRRSGSIARRELASYFYSPIAYVALTLFLLTTGYLFSRDFATGQPAGMRTLFDWMVWLLVFVVPVLCMGLISQEFATGTIEPLMTAPVVETDVVAGKFMGAMWFFGVLLAPTLLYIIPLKLYSNVELGPIASGYLGIILVGALFTSVGLFCSALTRSQVIAAVSSVAILFVITIVPWYALREGASTLGKTTRTVVDQGVYNRYVDFSRGIVDSGHVVFFVAVTLVFLFLTTKVLESRRWR